MAAFRKRGIPAIVAVLRALYASEELRPLVNSYMLLMLLGLSVYALWALSLLNNPTLNNLLSSLSSGLVISALVGFSHVAFRWHYETWALRLFWSKWFNGSERYCLLMPKRQTVGEEEIYVLLPPGEAIALYLFANLFKRLSPRHVSDVIILNESTSLRGARSSCFRGVSGRLSLLIVGGPCGNELAETVWSILGLGGKPLDWVEHREPCQLKVALDEEESILSQVLPSEGSDKLIDPFVIVYLALEDRLAVKMGRLLLGEEVEKLTLLNVAGCSAWGTAFAASLMMNEHSLRRLYEFGATRGIKVPNGNQRESVGFIIFGKAIIYGIRKLHVWEGRVFDAPSNDGGNISKSYLVSIQQESHDPYNMLFVNISKSFDDFEFTSSLRIIPIRAERLEQMDRTTLGQMDKEVGCISKYWRKSS